MRGFRIPGATARGGRRPDPCLPPKTLVGALLVEVADTVRERLEDGDADRRVVVHQGVELAMADDEQARGSLGRGGRGPGPTRRTSSAPRGPRAPTSQTRVRRVGP